MTTKFKFDVKDALVTRPMGSWRWQNAYAVSTYALIASSNTNRLNWKMVNRSTKMSQPQLQRYKVKWDVRGVPEPVMATIESHIDSPYNKDL